jgi:hypothetical protein
MSFLPVHFEWQEEYFAVSVSATVEAVRKYIKGQ